MRGRRSCRPPGGLSACRPTRRRLRPVTRVAGQGLTRAVRPSAVAVSAAAPPCAASASELPGPLAREGAASGALACSGVWPPGARGGPAPLLHGRRGPDATPEHLRVQGTGADSGLSLTREVRSIITPQRDFGLLSLVAQSTEIEQRSHAFVSRSGSEVRRSPLEENRDRENEAALGGMQPAEGGRACRGFLRAALTSDSPMSPPSTRSSQDWTRQPSRASRRKPSSTFKRPRGGRFTLSWAPWTSSKGIRPKVLEAYNRATGNPHMDLPRWLRHGSPVGITSCITPRGMPDGP